MALVLEFLSTSGVVQRYQILPFAKVSAASDQTAPSQQSAVTMGRSYDNDIVISDPYVCPLHAQLEWHENRLWLQNCSAVNGLQTANRKPLANRTQLPFNTVFIVGDQRLRVVDTDTVETEPALRRLALDTLSQRYNLWPIATVALLLLQAYAMWSVYNSKFSRVLPAQLIAGSYGLVVIALGIAFVLWLLQKLFRKDSTFFFNITLAGAVLGLLSLLNFGTDVIAFNNNSLQTVDVLQGLQLVLETTLLAVLLIGFLSKRWRPLRLGVISIVVGIATLGITQVWQDRGNKVYTTPQAKATVLAAPWQVSTPTPAAQWFEQNQVLFEQASHEAQRLQDDR